MTNRLPPKAVFCYSQHFAVHAGIHLETENCTDAISAYETMKSSEDPEQAERFMDVDALLTWLADKPDEMGGYLCLFSLNSGMRHAPTYMGCGCRLKWAVKGKY